MTNPVINELTDVILHAIAEWDAEYDDTDLTIRIRTEILKRFELKSIEDTEAVEHRAAMTAPFSDSERRALDAAEERRTPEGK